MESISGIGLLTALLAGTVSFLSPCVLPLVPGYLSYVGGQSLEDLKNPVSHEQRLTSVMLSLCFISGFATVFVALGASASAIGRLLAAYQYEANIVGGVVVLLFGLYMTGVFKFTGLMRDLRYHGAIRGGNVLGAYTLGLAFAFGWTPCIGPVLGSILTVSATASQQFNGLVLLSAYSFGLGIPFVVAALFTDRFLRWSRVLHRFGRSFQTGAGLILIAMGLAMMTGYLSRFAWWMLNVFPWMSEIG